MFLTLRKAHIQIYTVILGGSSYELLDEYEAMQISQSTAALVRISQTFAFLVLMLQKTLDTSMASKFSPNLQSYLIEDRRILIRQTP
jgi:hypothetical protein